MRTHTAWATAWAIALSFTGANRTPMVRAQARPALILPADEREHRSWDAAVAGMIQDGDLTLRRSDPDLMMAGRTHERFDQLYQGIPVYGGDVTRQTADGLAVSVFGTTYPDIAIDTTPTLEPSDAAAVIARDSGIALGPLKLPQLIVLPLDGAYVLAYRGAVFGPDGGIEYFIDARDGSIVRRLDAAQRQSVGKGMGVLGDAKKMSVSASNGTFQADDLLRPPVLRTFDMRGNLTRTLDFLNGFVLLGASDRAADSDNDWTDQAVVDAHAYAGYVYDYYYKRFGRKGLDDNNFRILSLVHPVSRDLVLGQTSQIQRLFYTNAFYAGEGVMVYGEGLPPTLTLGGQRWNYLSGALDVVAHELTHGVTDFTSGLLYEGEPGALNEAFSDMMGTATEFYFQPSGTGPLKADYLLGEDVITPNGIRSMSNPAQFGQPDHYSTRLIVPLSNDNGGVHTNSGIANQAYYLAIEGGTNRTSGLTVQGVGVANRDQIEKVMYRAFTQLMPASSTYAVARAATIQAARDLYGSGSAAERAIIAAWTAVGVN